MPGKRSYGSAGKWVHDRAHRIMDGRKADSLKERYGEEEGKSIAYAIATQQAHKLGKSPKGHRTKQGVRIAKRKFDKPLKEYRKTAGLLRPDQPRAKDVIKGRGPEKRKARAELRDRLREGCPKTASLCKLAGFFDELEKISNAQSFVGDNQNFRQVLRTEKLAQLVVLSKEASARDLEKVAIFGKLFSKKVIQTAKKAVGSPAGKVRAAPLPAKAPAPAMGRTEIVQRAQAAKPGSMDWYSSQRMLHESDQALKRGAEIAKARMSGMYGSAKKQGA